MKKAQIHGGSTGRLILTIYENNECGDEMKTLFMTVGGSYDIRSIMRTDIFRILKSTKGLRIVIFTPLYRNKRFISEFGGKNVIFENFFEWKMNIFERAIRKIQEIIFFNLNEIESAKVGELMLKDRSYPRYIIFKIVKGILGKNKNLINALERLDALLFTRKYASLEELFKKYKPSAFFIAEFLNLYMGGFTKISKKRNVPIIFMTANWDHLAKGRLPTPERVIVWSEFHKKQLMNYYGYKPDQIFIAGIPHSDYFVRYRSRFLSKRKFKKKIGAPPTKKLILYTTASAGAAPHETEMIETICRAIKEGKISCPAHLHVRLHPADDMRRHEKLKQYGDIISFEPPGAFATDVKDVWFPSEEDMIHYGNLLACSDVVVNVASTVSLDALMFDKPVVNICFDKSKRKYFESHTRFFKTTHYSALVKTGGVRVAKNEEELIKFINMYLKHPELDREKRKRAVREHCFKMDGKVGERVATFILRFIGIRSR
ncbi:MAG: CDP-glycerol glycerophosphotransferase family protein [Candidatus Hadarchaeales archaeon]